MNHHIHSLQNDVSNIKRLQTLLRLSLVDLEADIQNAAKVLQDHQNKPFSRKTISPWRKANKSPRQLVKK